MTKLNHDDLLDLRQLGYSAPLNAPGSEDHALSFLQYHRENERQRDPGANQTDPWKTIPVMPPEPPRKFPGWCLLIPMALLCIPLVAVGIVMGTIAGVMMGLYCCKELAVDLWRRIRVLTRGANPPPSAP